MLAFTVSVRRCNECPYRDWDGELEQQYCEVAPVHSEYKVYKENQNGITPSCPKFNGAIEC